jgi:hypothetical protein
MIARDVKTYCKSVELIENYKEAVTSPERYDCHHRLETHTSDGERRLVDLTLSELKALGMYYDRPPEELIFLKKIEHSRLHLRGKKQTEEHRRKNSEANKGKTVSKETRKKMSENRKGKHYYTNGIVTVLADVCPDGFRPGRIYKNKPTGRTKGAKASVPDWKIGMHWKIVDGKRIWYKKD